MHPLNDNLACLNLDKMKLWSFLLSVCYRALHPKLEEPTSCLKQQYFVAADFKLTLHVFNFAAPCALPTRDLSLHSMNVATSAWLEQGGVVDSCPCSQRKAGTLLLVLFDIYNRHNSSKCVVQKPHFEQLSKAYCPKQAIVAA